MEHGMLEEVGEGTVAQPVTHTNKVVLIEERLQSHPDDLATLTLCCLDPKVHQ